VLVHNAEALKLEIQDLHGVVISHLHADHVGGPRTAFRRTSLFRPSPWNPEDCLRTCQRRCVTTEPMSCSR
jgi:glyoxylase-like metal-dependent hydrolase (beta-lactamase superfamily II)